MTTKLDSVQFGENLICHFTTMYPLKFRNKTLSRYWWLKKLVKTFLTFYSFEGFPVSCPVMRTVSQMLSKWFKLAAWALVYQNLFLRKHDGVSIEPKQNWYKQNYKCSDYCNFIFFQITFLNPLWLLNVCLGSTLKCFTLIKI